MADTSNRAPQFPSRRIAVLSPTLAGGGAERKALFIASGLLERGHEVDILVQRLVCHYPDEVPGQARLFYLTSRRGGETRGLLDRLAVVPQPFFQGPTPWRARLPRTALLGKVRGKQFPLLMSTRPPRWAAGIAAYVDREQPSALLAMNVLAVTATTMAASLVRRRTRVVGTLHDVLRSGRLRERARRSYPFADFAVGVSRGTTAELEGIPDMARDRIHTIYNPVVSADLRRKARESPDHPWFDDRRRPVILAIGRMKKVKDFSTLLRAFARLLVRRPARLVVLGEGRLRTSLLSLARELGIAEQVAFPGFQENPYAFLAKADLFVLSSRHEALPTVLIEAMACGCPVVSTDCPLGPREILEDGRLGPLVPVGDAEALAEAMALTLDNPPDPDLLRERASFFNVEHAVERYERLLLG